MNDLAVADFLELVAARRGHFRLESGHHGGLWLDLDPLFAEAHRIDSFVRTLASAIRQYNVTWICGPLLGGAFLAQLVARVLGIQFCFTERVTPPATDGLYQVQYRLPPAFATRLRGQRIAMVDDVMSAGSALRGTYTELQAHGALPIGAGALLVLGSTGIEFFTEHNVPVEAAVRDRYDLWLPEHCPLCDAGVPFDETVT